MKKIGTILIIIMLVGAVFLSGCVDQTTDDGSTTPPVTEISLDEAIAILMSKIIDSSASDSRISAFMLTQPLRKDDIVASEDGNQYPVDSPSWFVFIDDEPELLFSHPTRYVFINGNDAIIDEVNGRFQVPFNDCLLRKDLIQSNLIAQKIGHLA